MQIDKLKIEKLYGYIDKEIKFNSDLTLLVGINGSGKTSILNLVNWLIRPSIPNLCVTEFKKLSLNFINKNSKYKIICEHTNGELTYKISTSKKHYNPLRIKMSHKPSEIGNDYELKTNLINQYSGLAPDFDEKDTWDLISKFPNPTIIGLDRNLFTEESSEMVFYENNFKGRPVRKRKKKISPLTRVKEIVNTEYRKKKNEILNLTNSLKNHLMLSTFDGGITKDSLIKGEKYKLKLNQIEDAEKKVNNYFKKFEKETVTPHENKKIEAYFSQLKQITKEYQKNPNNDYTKLLFSLNASQFFKVRQLLRKFEKFEKENLKVMSQVQKYLDTLNFFLKDSAKKIIFKEDTSELTFNTLDKNGDILKEFRDIKYLSSGEQQILILFSYIAFNSEDGKIFIIDEPELSLHIKWQEDFLKKLDIVTPQSTQLIIASHSPILANKRKDKAKLLLPYNE